MFLSTGLKKDILWKQNSAKSQNWKEHEKTKFLPAVSGLQSSFIDAGSQSLFTPPLCRSGWNEEWMDIERDGWRIEWMDSYRASGQLLVITFWQQMGSSPIYPSIPQSLHLLFHYTSLLLWLQLKLHLSFFFNLHHLELHLNMGLNMGGEGSLHRWSLVNVLLDASPVVHWLQRLRPLPSRCCDWRCCFGVWHLQHLMSFQVRHGQYHKPLNTLGVGVRWRPSAVCYWAGSVQLIYCQTTTIS